MTTLQFADTHNLVAFLIKYAKSEGFEQIVDFLNAINGEQQLQALVGGKKIVVTEASVRRYLQLDDKEGTDCLPNATIFKELTRTGYEKLSQKLTFYKAFFSPQWKFLIHTILQCLSAKTTAWNEFSSTMASAIICLATNQKFNFSKYIFESMVKNLDNAVKFLMYPRRPKEKDTQVPKSSVPSDPTNVADEDRVNTPRSVPEKESQEDRRDRKKDKNSGLKRGGQFIILKLIEDITMDTNVHEAILLACMILKVDEDISFRVEAKEQEELTIEEKSKLFQQLLEKRRKFFAA
ncbi:hypothetical protein Tco_0185313 [Tanacetum coccineum]